MNEAMLNSVGNVYWWTALTAGTLVAGIFIILISRKLHYPAVIFCICAWLVLVASVYAYTFDENRIWNNFLIFLASATTISYFLLIIIVPIFIWQYWEHGKMYSSIIVGMLSVILATFYFPAAAVYSRCYIVGDCLWPLLAESRHKLNR